MKPIPESVEAVEEFGPFSDDDVLGQLEEKCARVRDVVPDCVGVSVASNRSGVTLTVVATPDEIAVLDAVQYLDGGPCLRAGADGSLVACSDTGVIDEHGWHLFARATAARAVRSTLSLPVISEGHVVGSVNLYAASAGGFTGHHEQVARIFHAWAPGAVTNADLGFSTRALAEQAPQLLQDEVQIEVACGLVSQLLDCDLAAARAHVSQSAQRAGASERQLADLIIALR